MSFGPKRKHLRNKPFSKQSLEVNKGESSSLTVRAQNVIASLGGLEHAKKYFINNEDSIKIKNCGNKTRLELIHYFNEFISQSVNINENQNSEDEIKGIGIDQNKNTLYKAISNNPLILDYVYSYYLDEINNLTTRIKNVIQSLEPKMAYDENQSAWLEYFFKYFLNPFNYNSIKKLGAKSIIELNIVATRIRSNATILVENQESKLDSKSQTINVLLRRLKGKLNRDEIRLALDLNTDEIDFFKLSKLLLQKEINTPSRSIVYEKYSYYSNARYKSENKLPISRERERQIYSKIVNEEIPKIIEISKNACCDLNTTLSNYKNKNWITIDSLPEISSAETRASNRKLIPEILMECSLKGSHVSLKDIWDFTASKSFDLETKIFLISIEFSEALKINELLSWLEIEIYNFELSAFDYDLKVLVNRFYSENSIYISKERLYSLVELIQDIIRRDWSPYIKKRLNSIKKLEEELIIEKIESFLESKSTSSKTAEIREYLIQCNNEISIQRLLSILGNYPQKFLRAGIGNWTHISHQNKFSGSIRDFTHLQLINRDAPIHISELLKLLNMFRDTTENSLKYNLKLATSNFFCFFNCGYIGLTSKKYDDYYYKIPKFVPSNLEYFIKIHRDKPLQELINLIVNKFNYPEEHIRYILNKKDIIKNAP